MKGKRNFEPKLVLFWCSCLFFTAPAAAQSLDPRTLMSGILEGFDKNSLELIAAVPAQVMLTESGQNNEKVKKNYFSAYGLQIKLAYALSHKFFLEGHYGMQFSTAALADSVYGGSLRYSVFGGAPRSLRPSGPGGATIEHKPRFGLLLGAGVSVHSIDLKSYETADQKNLAFGKRPETEARIVSFDLEPEFKVHWNEKASIGIFCQYGTMLSSSNPNLSASFVRAGLRVGTWL